MVTVIGSYLVGVRLRRREFPHFSCRPTWRFVKLCSGAHGPGHVTCCHVAHAPSRAERPTRFRTRSRRQDTGGVSGLKGRKIMALTHLRTYLNDHLAGSVVALDLLAHLEKEY